MGLEMLSNFIIEVFNTEILKNLVNKEENH